MPSSAARTTNAFDIGSIHRLVSAVIALFAIIGCNNSNQPTYTREFTLRLTTDSAYVNSDCTTGGLYCFTAAPNSGTMTARLLIGPPTSDLSSPTCCLGKIVSADDPVLFADSLVGKLVIDTDGIVTVFAGPDPWYGIYDSYTLTGRITNGQYTGRWKQSIDPHGRANLGSFVSIP